MSATEEREIEIVAGTIGGITQKKADTWTIQVTPEGSQYARNLWTKDVDLKESLESKIGQHGSFVAEHGKPYMVQGKEVRSWWIVPESEIEHTVTASSVATPESVVKDADTQSFKVGGPQPAAPIAGASKDRLIVRQTCIKAAAELYAGQGYWSLTGDPTDLADTAEAIMKAAARFERWVTLGILEPIPFD